MNKKTTSTFTKMDNGNIEIIYTIPVDLIATNKEIVIKKMAKDIVVPGFRKGMAPVTKVVEKIDENKINEQILGLILPLAFADSVKEHKFNPAIYPKFEVIKIGQGSEWEIKAITCELPQVVLPKNYKKNLKKDSKDQNTLTSEAGQALLIKSLLETIKLEIPRVLIEEEVNARLSQVLDRIDKLGLALEGYLKSVGKTAEILRSEYEVQAKDSISLELILNTIANDEKIEVTEKEIDDFIKTTGSELNQVEKGQRDILKRVILRKSALEKLSK
jgi:FKBP-type peptidyl-prolyl cis-trans isomerase (trigger factor)